GSSFQLQHWTHDFAYALVSGDGDWRALTLPALGQEFNHPLYAVLPGSHAGPRSPSTPRAASRCASWRPPAWAGPPASPAPWTSPPCTPPTSWNARAL